MHIVAILNRDGGTLRTMDLAAFAKTLADTFSSNGHTLDIEIVAGDDLLATLDAAIKRDDVDAILAGGGDGTVSAAAAALAGTEKALAILPAGTMNLFARSLGLPLDLEEAVRCLAVAPIRAVDVASVDGRIFVHQYSVGLHAKMVALREEMTFSSRLGKIFASWRAALVALVRPPVMRVRLVIDGSEIVARTSAISVSNNLFGEGHLPYADRPDGGRLGIYITTARGVSEMAGLLVNMLVGRWRANPQVEIHETGEVRIFFEKVKARHRAVIDGELCKIDRDVQFKSHPGALKVIAPAALP